ncbi:MAG: hypothetical protein AB1490_10350 [Pseudomonadota bacterium]
MPFLGGCALLYIGLALLLPRYFPLIEPDSEGYIAFFNNRTAVYPLVLRLLTWTGLDLIQITYIQLLGFAAALMFLLASLLRASVPPVLVVLFVVALGLNGYFSGFAFTIMSETLFFAVGVIAIAFWLDYFRSGKAGYLAGLSLCVGLLIGIRPIGWAFVPFVLISVWLQSAHRSISPAILAIALILPSAAAIVGERIAHRVVHERRESILPYALIGKAAMLVRQDTVFGGPHADQLNQLGGRLAVEFAPVPDFLAGVPFLARPIVTAAYEGVGQFLALPQEIAEISKASNVPEDTLRTELGKQSIFANLPDYARLTLTHYFGQWSIMALTFPPTTRAFNAYLAAHPSIPLADKVNAIILKPPEKLISFLVYPAFLMAGAISLALSPLLIVFMARRMLGATQRGHFLMLSCFFAAMAHSYTILISLVNVSTPRFLMGVYPQLILVGVFLLLAIKPRWAVAQNS